MRTLWGRANSSNVMKVIWTLEELKQPYRRVDIGGAFGGNKESKYLAMNPNGLVPTLEEDDGFILWESNAIVRYLAAKHGEGSLWPKDLKVRADADRWMDWVGPVLGPSMTALLFGYYRTPPEKRDAQALDEARKRAAEGWAILDRHLHGRRCVVGDSLTMGDIPAGVLAHRWFSFPIERPDMPNLARYYATLKERPAYVQHIAQPVS
jgi:glutathione S-transferase